MAFNNYQYRSSNYIPSTNTLGRSMSELTNFPAYQIKSKTKTNYLKFITIQVGHSSFSFNITTKPKTTSIKLNSTIQAFLNSSNQEINTLLLNVVKQNLPSNKLVNMTAKIKLQLRDKTDTTSKGALALVDMLDKFDLNDEDKGLLMAILILNINNKQDCLQRIYKQDAKCADREISSIFDRNPDTFKGLITNLFVKLLGPEVNVNHQNQSVLTRTIHVSNEIYNDPSQLDFDTMRTLIGLDVADAVYINADDKSFTLSEDYISTRLSDILYENIFG